MTGAAGDPDSYYAASANPSPPRPPFAGEAAPEVCIVGAGFTGLSAAIELAERGHEVVVLDARRVGWGASGRNGGQIVNGLSADLEAIERRCGALGVGPVREGAALIRDRVARYAIACDLKDGSLFGAMTERQMRELEHRQAMWRRLGIDTFRLLDRAGVREQVATEAYLGGMVDPTGGHLHPLNLALGEAAAVESLGGTLHDQTPVQWIQGVEGRPVVGVPGGVLRPEVLILAGNAYLGALVPEIENRILPFSTQMIATEPLGERGTALIPSDFCVEDERYIQDYYRLSADRRLLFGGGAVFGGTEPADIRAKLRPNLERLFPQLRGVRIDHAWSGNCALAFTRMPQIGRLGPATYFAQGYSGHGVVGSHLFGRMLGQAVHGDRAAFDAFAAAPWMPFPGGRRFSVPYTMLGSWWYGLRDRLNL